MGDGKFAAYGLLTADPPLHLPCKTIIFISFDSLTIKPLIMKHIAPPYGILTILLLAVSCLITIPMEAQTILIDSIFTSDGEIFPFEPDDTIYGLSISGSVNLNSDTSLVRVILTDEAGYEWMVYEAYRQIVYDTTLTFTSDCDETCYLNGPVPLTIKIYLTAAQITIDSLNIDTLFHEDLPELIETSLNSMVQRKISALNDYIDEKMMIWFAGETAMSNWMYERKKNTFGEKYLLYGLDYYAGGIFDPCRITHHLQITLIL